MKKLRPGRELRSRLDRLEADAAGDRRRRCCSGAFAVWKLPREEEPQIVVPMVDVFVQMPGASAREVEERVTKPMEKLLWEIPGVEYIYSTSSPGMSTVIVRFLSGRTKKRASSG